MKVMTWRRILFRPKLIIVGVGMASAVSAQSQTFPVVASWPASLEGTPSSQGTNGNLYGTTAGIEFSSNGGVFEYTTEGGLAGFLVCTVLAMLTRRRESPWPMTGTSTEHRLRAGRADMAQYLELQLRVS